MTNDPNLGESENQNESNEGIEELTSEQTEEFNTDPPPHGGGGGFALTDPPPHGGGGGKSGINESVEG